MYGYNWEITVRAGSYFPSLTYSFDGKDIQLAYENDEMGMQFFAYSSHIENLTDPSQVATRLGSLELLLNGALRIASGCCFHVPIRFVEFSSKETGFYSVTSNEIEVNPFDAGVATHAPGGRQVDLASSILHQSTHDYSIRQLLFLSGLISNDSLASRIISWGTLYRILDTLKFLSKEISVDFKSLADSEKIGRFKAACNSMSVLGIFARHGLSSQNPPLRVLTDLDEAINLLLESAGIVVDVYLKSKIGLSAVLPSLKNADEA